MSWEYFDKFEAINDKYLPSWGEGETLATQICTAVNKLVYKWFNDGDVFDNVHCPLDGWANDLTDYANWLYKNTDADAILDSICDCECGDDYETLLMDLADLLLTDEVMEAASKKPAVGTIYDCDGPFEFDEFKGEEEEEEEW